MGIKSGLVVILLFFFCTVIKAQKLTYVAKNVSLVQIFKEIRKQTGISVVWNESEFNVNRQMDASFKNAELKTVMDEISAQLPVSYTILSRNIVVKERKDIVKPMVVATHKNENNPSTVDTIKQFNLETVEIVSTGYQRIPRERATGSFVLVDSLQLDRKVGNNIFSRLEGITSGLLFNKNTLGSNSGNLDLSIRGRSTIYANDQPLIILDDFPFNGDFNSINPNDVANITILKDAAAASIWGVRAGNGVIVMTTKKGNYNQSLNLSFNSNVTVAGKPDIFANPNYLSSTDFVNIETFLFNNGKYDAALTDKVNYPAVSSAVQILDRQRKGQSASITADQLNALRRTDVRQEELRYFYRKAVLQQYFFQLDKGTSISNHYLSAGYNHTLFSLINNVDNRTTLNTRHSVKLFKNLEANAEFNYVRRTGTLDSTSIQILNSISPYYQFKDANGIANRLDRHHPDFYTQAIDKGFLDWSYVPLNELSQPKTALTGNDLRFKGGLKYSLLKGLSAEVKYQYQYIGNIEELIEGLDAYSTRNIINRYAIVNNGKVTGFPIPIGTIAYRTSLVATSKNFRTQLNYQREWLKHAISAIAGYELSEFDTQADQNLYYGHNVQTGQSANVDTITTFNLNPTGKGKITSNNNLFGRLDRIRSVFGNLGYTFNNKYTFSGSARIDGSNYFGVKTNQKNVPLWSAGMLWHLDREAFYKLNWLPVLKFSATYGYNGNLDKSITGITTFRSGLTANYTNLPYANIVNVGNPELRWERIGIANFGLDFGFRNQVVIGRLEYYFKNGRDMLGDKAFASSTGIKVLRGNFSEMSASGIDLSLTSNNLTGSVKWKSNLLFSKVSDKITLYDVLDPNSNQYVGSYNGSPVLGKPVHVIYSYKWAGLDPLNGDPQGYLDGRISKDYTSIINEPGTSGLEYNGPGRPTVFGALNNTVYFRKFTLGINISYKLGYYFRKLSVNYYNMYSDLDLNTHNDFSRRWQKTGDENRTNVPSMANYSDGQARDLFYNGSSATVAKGDHIRLQDISLSFDLDRLNWKGIRFKQLQLYVYANNLGIIWKANDFGIDPDFIPVTGQRFNNVEPKTFSFGIKGRF